MKNGDVEWKFQWQVNHNTRTYGWFLVIADCALEQYNTKVSPMKYDITLINPGNTHLPADEFGLPKVYVVVFLLMSLFFAYIGREVYKQQKEKKTIHLVVALLIFAYGLQYVSIFYELIHLYAYKHNGYGVFLCDFISEVLEGLSQTLIAFVLICLASGWTLVDMDADKARGNSVATLLRDPITNVLMVPIY